MKRGMVSLGGGWHMVYPMTRHTAEALYLRLDAEELDELAAVGCDMARFVRDALDADRSAAFFRNWRLVFGICANTVEIPTVGMCRLWDTMSTVDVRAGGRKSIRDFVKMTPVMRDAFMADEPCGLPFVGVVKSDFARSRKWIEKVVGFTEYADADLNGVKHTIYTYKAKEKEA